MKKTVQPSVTPSAQQIQAILKKPETIIGGLVLLATGVFAATSIMSSRNQATAVLPAFPEIIANETATDSAELAQQPAIETAPSVEEIQVLANTSSTAVVIAQPGDTIWNLTISYCGTDATAELVEKTNGYGRRRELQAGDKLTIVCE